MSKLSKAIEEVERDHPLPRCEHGQALRDHSGEALEPPCGCRASDQLTIEDCLKELRVMFPQTYISLTATAIWFADETQYGANYNIVVGAHRYEFFGKTLDLAMAQVRAFKQSQDNKRSK